MRNRETISLVICTHNRRASLERCLNAAFSTDSSEPFELVVVDNASTDGTSEYLAALPGRGSHVSVKTLTEPTPGKGRALNVGWKASSGSIVALTDDDCYLASDYMTAIKSAFEDSSIGVVGGRILLYNQEDYNITTRTDLSPQFYEPYTFIWPGAIQGANMAFRRSVLERIGGFDDRIGVGTSFPCEDVVAVANALWHGIAAKYDPRPTVSHHHGRQTKEQLEKLLQNYCAGRGAYYAIFIANRASRRVYLLKFGRQTLRALVFLLCGRWGPMQEIIQEIRAAITFACEGRRARR